MSGRKSATDQEIIMLYEAGDHDAALQIIINEYQTRLYSLAYQMLGNYDDAMDVLQEILIQVHRSLGTFEGHSSLYTWLYRLSSNVCLNYRKKRNRLSNQVEWDENVYQAVMLSIERPNEDPDTMCEVKYKKFLVQQALLKLPEAQRVLIVLHDLEGITVPEIASILKIDANAAKSRLHRGRAALRKIISKGFEVKGMEAVGSFLVGPSGQLL